MPVSPILTLAIPVLLALPGCTGGRDEFPVEAVVGGPGRVDGRFVSPRAVAFDRRSGEICVVDRSGRIQRFAPADGGGGPGSGSSPPRWTFQGAWYLEEYRNGQPTGLCFDREGRLLVADTHYQRILRYDPETGLLLESWGRPGSGPGEFTQVRDVVQDSAGAIYAGDYGGPIDRIQKFDGEGNFLLQFGSRGSGPGQFRRPQGLAVARDRSGRETLLVADSCNHRVQRFGLEGEFIVQWGTLGDGPGEFKYPFGVAAEEGPGGDIFVVEWSNNRVQRLDSEGRFRGFWGGPGREPGRMATPWDVARAPDGRLFVADFGNDRIQVFRWPEGLAAAWTGGAPLEVTRVGSKGVATRP